MLCLYLLQKYVNPKSNSIIDRAAARALHAKNIHIGTDIPRGRKP